MIQRNRRILLKEKIQISLHDLDTEVYSDSKWLAFILQQILSNSVKYMGTGEEAGVVCSSRKRDGKAVFKGYRNRNCRAGFTKGL